jgi:CRP-like cAMP-binding protein
MSDVFAAFSRFAKTFPKGSVIFSEFEPGDCFYLIQSGRVQLIKIVNGFEKNLDILQPSEIFGEMAILENSPRSATAIAFDDVKALEFNKANFEVLMMGNPAIAMKLLKTFVKRIYAQKRRFMVLTVPDKMARVGDVFLMLDETQPSPDKTADFRNFNISMDDVARWAGLPLEAVQDEIHRYMDQGKMDVYEDHIMVKNLPELSRYVNARRIKEPERN